MDQKNLMNYIVKLLTNALGHDNLDVGKVRESAHVY